MLSTQSDERLVDLVRAGSDPAFEAIVERYRRALLRYVSRLLAPERAEDVVQQAFVKAYEAMHRNSAELNLRPWLYRIAHNGALNAMRDRGAAHVELSDTIDGVERPDQAFERTHGLRELVVAVQALPDRQRSAILLREMEGRSYEEIATALGVSDGAVRQLLHRARTSLRAAAASVIPVPVVERVASYASSDPVSGRMAEIVGAGSGALAIKLCATALVTGAVVGGAALVPGTGDDRARQAGAGIEAADAAEPADGSGGSGSGGGPSSRSDSRADGGSSRDGGGDRRGGGSAPADPTRGDRRSGDDGSSDRRGGDDGTDDRGGGREPGDDGGRSGGDRTDRGDGGGDDGGGGSSGPGGGDGSDDGVPVGGLPSPIDEPTDAREDATGSDGGEASSGPDGGGSGSDGGGSGSGSGSDDLPEPQPLE